MPLSFGGGRHRWSPSTSGIAGIGVDSRMTWVGIVAGMAVDRAGRRAGGAAGAAPARALPRAGHPGLRRRHVDAGAARDQRPALVRPRHRAVPERAADRAATEDRPARPRREHHLPGRPRGGLRGARRRSIVALRNSGYGRRLVAMRDSPAATAMLGQRLVWLKLGVFMLSAAIAGLGGVLLAGAQGSVSGDDYLDHRQPRPGHAHRRRRRQLRERRAVRRRPGRCRCSRRSRAPPVASAADNPDLAPVFELLAHLGGLAIALTGLGVNAQPERASSTRSATPTDRCATPARCCTAGWRCDGRCWSCSTWPRCIGDWSFALLTMLVVFGAAGARGRADARAGADAAARSRSGDGPSRTPSSGRAWPRR